MNRIAFAASLLALTAVSAASSPAVDTTAQAWQHLPELEATVVGAMDEAGGGTAEVNGDPGLGCFELRLTAASPATSLPEVQRSLEDALRARGAVVSIAEVEGTTRFRIGDLDGLAVTSIEPTSKAARTVACLCRDRYPEQAMQTCQRITESSAP